MNQIGIERWIRIGRGPALVAADSAYSTGEADRAKPSQERLSAPVVVTGPIEQADLDATA